MSIKKVPLRQCIGCGEMKNKKEMIRVLKTTEGEIVLDATGRQNGRGAYVCSTMECLKKAIRGKGLERSFKMPIPKEVYETLEKEMEQLGEQSKGF
ncbi:MAG: YlxR family protein [Hungatella sp.]